MMANQPLSRPVSGHVTRQDLENALKDAMRAQDDLRKRTLRLLLSSIKLAEVEKNSPLNEAEILAVIQKEVKSRQETIAEAERGHRDDIAAENQAEISVLQGFLPEPLSAGQLEDLARGVIQEVGAASMADMGKVMKELTPRLEGRASGKDASDTVRRLLQGH
jgi:uncharacterized protein